MIRLSAPSSKFLRLALVLTAFAAVALLAGDALAQTNTQFKDTQESVANDVGLFPKFMSTVSYVVGVYFAADGLLKLKAWMEDSQKNSITHAIFRLSVAGLMVWLPHGMFLANATLFGEGAGGANTPAIAPPQLGVFDKKK